MNQKITKFLACILVFFALSNSDLMAQCAAGETEVSIVINADPTNFPTDISWTLVEDATGTVLLSQPCAFYTDLAPSSTDNICLTDGATYTLSLLDDYGDAWGFDADWEIVRLSDGCVIGGGINPDNGAFGDNTDDCVGDDLEDSYTFDPVAAIMGCTDPAAINYNPCATIDDGSCIYPALNDECVDAIEVPVNTDGTCTMTASATNIGATYSASAGPPDITCYAAETNPNDIWFKFAVPASGNVYVTLGPSTDFGFMLAEYFVGSCGALTPGPISCGFPVDLTATGLTAGDTIYMRVWDDFPLFGGTTAEICVQDPVAGCTDPCATNYDPLAIVDDGSCISSTTDIEDLCADAIDVMEGSTYFDITGFSGTDITACTYNDFISGWFTYDVPASCDTLQVSTCGSFFDTGLSIWTDCPASGGFEIGCNDDDPFVGGLCGGGTVSSIVLPAATIAGTTVYIRVSGFNGAQGCGDLTVNCISGSTGPCSSATAPDNLNSALDAVSLTAELSWDPIPSSVMCQIRWRSTAFTGWEQNNLYGSEIASTTMPRSLLDYSESYQWMVRCACDFDIADATPFSEQDTFNTPAARVPLTLEAKLYPNPADQMMTVAYQTQNDSETILRITDLAGRVVLQRNEALFSGGGTIRINTSSLEDGLYLLHADGEVRQFMVAH